MTQTSQTEYDNYEEGHESQERHQSLYLATLRQDGEPGGEVPTQESLSQGHDTDQSQVVADDATNIEEQFVYFHCPDLPQFRYKLFRYSAVTASPELEKIQLPSQERFNFIDSRILQKGQAVLVFYCNKMEIHARKLQGLESEELRSEPLANIEREAKHFAIASDQKQSVYLTGGGTGAEYDESISKVSRLDTEANQWTDLTEMTMARQNHSAIVQGNRLYVFGGF